MNGVPGQRRGITGRGHALPGNVRTNADPVFNWLKQYDPDNWTEYFNGYDQRRVLKAGERLVDLMLEAAQQALAMAGLKPSDVNLLTGFASVSEHVMPNELAQLHQLLGLDDGCWVLPVNNEYSNFNAGLVLADALMHGGQIGNALVVCGGNWSRYVDYHAGAAASAADGAGAAVLQYTDDPTTFRVVDAQTYTRTIWPPAPRTPPAPAYGHMMMSSDRLGGPAPGMLTTPDVGGPLSDPGLFTQPYFHLDGIGLGEFKSFGIDGPVTAAQSLLQRNALTGSEVTIIAHQTSRFLLDAWKAQIAPHQLIDTLSTFANMTLASIPVNLSFAHDQIETDHLVLLGIGPELHSHALLLRRNG